MIFKSLAKISLIPIVTISSLIPVMSFVANNDTNFEFSYEYLHMFSKNEYNFSNISNKTFWSNNEILYQSNDFQIKFDSQNESNSFYLDIYNYNIYRWYFVKISYNPLVDFNSLNKILVNQLIAKTLIDNWKNDVSGVFEISKKIALNREKNKVIRNGLASFQSSWGVWNQSKGIVETEYQVTVNDIREGLEFQTNDNSIEIEKTILNGLYYIPLIEILDPPVGEAYWNQKSIMINNKNINSSLNNKKHPLLLPHNADSGQEWWKWFTNGNDKTYINKVIEMTSSIIGSIISEIIIEDGGFIGSAVGAFIGQSISDYVDLLLAENKFNYNYNKVEFDNYYNTIIEKGYFVNMNSLELNNDDVNTILINSEVEYRAKATAIFGDGTTAKIYSTPAVIDIKSEVRKYVEK